MKLTSGSMSSAFQKRLPKFFRMKEFSASCHCFLGRRQLFTSYYINNPPTTKRHLTLPPRLSSFPLLPSSSIHPSKWALGVRREIILASLPISIGAARLRSAINLVGVVPVICDRPVVTFNLRAVATVDAAFYATFAVALSGGEGLAGALVEIGGDLDVGVGVKGWIGDGEAEKDGGGEELEELHCDRWIDCVASGLVLSMCFRRNRMFVFIALFEYEAWKFGGGCNLATGRHRRDYIVNPLPDAGSCGSPHPGASTKG